MALQLMGTQNKLVATELANVVVANSTTESRLFSAAYSIGQDQLAIGKKIRVHYKGQLTTIATPGTISFRMDVGGTDLYTLTFTPTDNLSGEAWDIEAGFEVRTRGLTGTVMPYFKMTSNDATLQRVVAPTTAITVNSTVARLLDATVQFATADAGNSITCTGGTIELI